MTFSGCNRFEDSSTFRVPFFAYVIEHPDILNKDTHYFLKFWDIGRIAKANRLHDMFGKVRFMVDGYNDDERELFEISEVRNFLSQLTDKWPYFFYAADLEDRFLNYLIKCLVPRLSVVRAPNMPTDWVATVRMSDVNDVCGRLQKGFHHAASMDSQLNQPEIDIRNRQLDAYLHKEILGKW